MKAVFGFLLLGMTMNSQSDLPRTRAELTAYEETTRYEEVMDFIGNTPLVKLNHLTDGDCADIYVKFEAANPTGSWASPWGSPGPARCRFTDWSIRRWQHRRSPHSMRYLEDERS